jgi:predicted PurR-regulated permease PerM
MINYRAQRIFFGVLLVAVTAAFIWLIRGFIQPIFWAVALGIVFFPMHRKLKSLLRGRNSVAAAFSVIIILLIVVLPLGAIVSAMASEATGIYQRVTCDPNEPVAADEADEADERACDKIDVAEYVATASDWAQRILPAPIADRVRSTLEDSGLPSQLTSSAVTVSQFLATQAVAIGQNTIRIAVYFFLMLYLLFFSCATARNCSTPWSGHCLSVTTANGTCSSALQRSHARQLKVRSWSESHRAQSAASCLRCSVSARRCCGALSWRC